MVRVGLLEVDEFFSKKNDQLAEGFPFAVEGLEQRVECLSALIHCLVVARMIPTINQLVELRSAVRSFLVVRRALGAVKQKKGVAKSKKQNFLLRLADGERDAVVIFLALNVVALQGAQEVVGTVALFAVISTCSARARASTSCALEVEAPPPKNPPDERAAASEEEENISACGGSGQ
eukprot:869791-Rhodomonas_salina.1